MSRRRRVHSDQGETLLELLIAITILGVCVVAIGAGIASAVLVSGLHRDQADATRILHNYAETLEAATYTNCASSYTLPTQTGFQAPALTITYWNPTANGGNGAFQNSCPSPDQGLQRVKIDLTSVDNRVHDSLTLVLRNPS